MKKLLLALIVALTLTGCSASSDASSSSSAAMSMPESATDTVTTTSSSTGGSIVTTQSKSQDSKFIYTVYLDAETTTFDQDVVTLKDLVSGMDGYFEYASEQDRGSYRYGDYVIRIPTDQLDAFTEQTGAFFLLTSSTSQQEDISYQYYDTQGRLETQQLKLERLQELLSKAETMEDLIALESAISQTQEEIDSYSGTMVYYNSQVDYATVHLSVQEVSTLSNVEMTPIGFGARLGRAFTTGISNFTNSLENLAISLAFNWLTLVVWAGIILVVVRIVKRKGLKRPHLPNWGKKE